MLEKNTVNIAVVTGANGFVGSHLVEFLLEKGYEVRCIIRKTSNLKWIAHLPIKFYDCGLTEVEKIREVCQDAHYIYHIAGVVAAKQKSYFYEGNVETTRNVLEAAKGISSIRKVLITSSLAACAPTAKGRPVTELTPSNPVSIYGKSKAAQEVLARQYMNELPIVIVRPPVVYGQRETELLLLFKTIKSGLSVTVGRSEKYISLVYVHDLVRGLYLAATAEISKGKTYFIGSEQAEYGTRELNRLVAEHLGVKPLKIRVPHGVLFAVAGVAQFFGQFSRKPPTLHLEKAKEMTQESWSCSSEKAQAELGYGDTTDLREGLRQTINWYKKEGWL